MSWVDRSSLWSHPDPLVPPPLGRRPHIFPPRCHMIGCRQLCYRCSWPPSHIDLRCGCGSEGPKSASTPWGCCWPCGRAWCLLDSRDLREKKEFHEKQSWWFRITLVVVDVCVCDCMCVFLSSLDENPRYLHSDMCPVLLMASRLTL